MQRPALTPRNSNEGKLVNICWKFSIEVDCEVKVGRQDKLWKKEWDSRGAQWRQAVPPKVSHGSARKTELGEMC